MKSMKVEKIFIVAMIVGGSGFSSISADAVAPKNSIGKVTFTAGDLTLDKVPSFDFGSQKITIQDQDYNAQEKSEVQVTDLRGSSVGWTLTVTAGKLKAGMKELTGSQVSLANGSVVNTNNETVTVLNTTLTPNQAVKVMEATVGNGNGVTIGNWKKTDVNLHVPGSSEKSVAQYTADLTWTLADAPAP